MMFEVWNHDSGNAVGEFETIESTLLAIHDETDAHGPAYVADWTLVAAGDTETQTIAAGDLLVTLATTLHAVRNRKTVRVGGQRRKQLPARLRAKPVISRNLNHGKYLCFSTREEGLNSLTTSKQEASNTNGQGT